MPPVYSYEGELTTIDYQPAKFFRMAFLMIGVTDTKGTKFTLECSGDTAQVLSYYLEIGYIYKFDVDDTGNLSGAAFIR